MKNQKDRKLNNKGFTLVELLIAIAIVAVIVAPVLHSMTTSMRVNKKADDLLNETAVAQTVMEGINNRSLEEIAFEFTGLNPNPLKFFPDGFGGTAHKELTPAAGGSSVSLVDGNMKFQKLSGHVYSYGIKDINYDGKRYDVKVTLDASKYYKAPGDPDDKYNDKEYVDISDYDSDYDALYVQSATVNAEMCRKLSTKCVTAGNNKTADDIAEESNRTITVKIEKGTAPDGTDSLITVNVNYKLEIPQDYVEEHAKNYEEQNYVSLYSNKKDTSLMPRNIYILYNPNYNSTNTHKKDKIVVENTDNIPVTVYLVKQNSVEASKLEGLENNYHVAIEVKEGTKGADYATGFRTNIGYNLFNLLKKNEYKEIPMQGRITYDCNGSVSEADIYSDTDVITGKSNETVRIFKKTVEVYPNGAYDGNFSGSPLATLSSE